MKNLSSKRKYYRFCVQTPLGYQSIFLAFYQINLADVTALCYHPR